MIAIAKEIQANDRSEIDFAEIQKELAKWLNMSSSFRRLEIERLRQKKKKKKQVLPF